jgi:mannose-6-phosphate isomerase-like protein (cupin superfamily)
MVERLSSLLKVPVAGTIYRPIRKALGVTAFGINAYTGEKAGDLVIEPHDETGAGSGKHEELYVVMTGAARFEVDGEPVEAPAGSFVLVQPEQHRVAHAVEGDTTVLVIGGKPGTAGPASPFEYWYLATPAYDAGDYEQAYAIAAAGLVDHPENTSLNYQLACYSALAGRPDDARRHLKIAFNDPRAVEWAKTDSDLVSLKDDLP